MDIFNDQEEAKSKYLVQVRHWDKNQCIDFLSQIRSRYNLAPNIQLSTAEVLNQLSLVELKTQVIQLVQSCEDISQLASYENNIL